MKKLSFILLVLILSNSINSSATDNGLPNQLNDKQNIKNTKVIGTWYNADSAETRSFEKVGSKYYYVLRYSDGSGGKYDRQLLKINFNTFRPKPSTEQGDYYVIQKNGELDVRDKEGLISTLPKHVGLWPNSKEQVVTDIKRKESVPLSRTPIEQEAIISENLKDDPRALEVMAIQVKANGYKCDSISSARTMLVSRGFVIGCNHFAYEYEIEDKGGQLRVTVK